MSDSQQRQPRGATVFTRTERSSEEVVLAADGPLTDDNADEFKAQLDALLAGGWPIVTLDLSLVKGMSSNPLGKIVMLKMRLQERHRTLRVRGCDPELYELFRKIKYDRIITITQQA